MNKLIRKEKKWKLFNMEFDSLKESAEYFGVSQSMMSAIFSGKKSPTKEMLAQCGYKKIVNKTVTYEKI